MNKEKSTPQKAYDVCHMLIGAFKKGDEIGAIEWPDLEACYEAALVVRRELKRRGKVGRPGATNKLRVRRKKS
jgi:hypothetical protein